jgi:hypothetical protein
MLCIKLKQSFVLASGHVHISLILLWLRVAALRFRQTVAVHESGKAQLTMNTIQEEEKDEKKEEEMESENRRRGRVRIKIRRTRENDDDEENWKVKDLNY